MSRIEKVAIKDLLPNPFRNMDHYRIPEAKIEALIRSFKTTGFWPNVIGRPAGNKVEKAFGHARTEAGRRLYGEGHKIDVVVMELSDEQMLKMMADENGELWGTDFLVDMETVEAVIDACIAGIIKLEAVPKNNVPRFLRRDARRVAPFSTVNVAKFLGWLERKGSPQERVGVAIRALQLIEEGTLKVEQFAGLGNKTANALVQEAETAKKRVALEADTRKQAIADAQEQVEKASSAKAKEQAEQKRRKYQDLDDRMAAIPAQVGEAVSAAMKTGKVGYREARRVTESITDNKAFKPLPPSGEFIRRLCTSLAIVLSPRHGEIGKRLQSVLDARDVLPKEQLEELAGSLVEVSEECLELAAKLRGSVSQKRNNNLRLK